LLVAVPVTAQEWNGSIGAAFVWDDVSGNQDSFRSQFKLEDGFLLEDLTLGYSGDSGLREFSLDAWGFGDAEPSEAARLGFVFGGGLGLDIAYDRRESFFRLSESDLGWRADDWDVTRWRGTLSIDSWQPLKIELIARHYQRDGTVERPTYGLNQLYPVSIDLDESMTEATLRLSTRTLPVRISFEQSWAEYERNNRRSVAGQQALLPPPDPDLLVDTATDYQDTIDVPTSRLTLSYASRSFEGVASLLYADSELDAGGVGFNTFGVGGGDTGTIDYINDVIGSANTDNLVGRINLGFSVASSWVIRIAGDYRDASTDTGLLGTRLIRATSPTGDAIELSAPIDENGVYDFEDSELRAQLEYRRPSWSLWAGGLSGSRDVSWRQTADDELIDISRDTDGYFVGASWNPDRRLDFSFEYQSGDFTNYVFRTDPGTVDRYSIRLRSQLGKGWQLAAFGRHEEADNPPELAGLDHKNNPYGLTLNWSSSDGQSTAGLDLERFNIETDTGLVLPTGEDALSRYELDASSATLFGDTRIGIFGLRASVSYLEDDGDTWPVEALNGEVRLSIHGGESITYGVFVQYWDYDEKRSDGDDFEVTRAGVSVQWRFQ